MTRKELVTAIGEQLNQKPKYLGPPSFAYEVETENETYTIDKESQIMTSNGEFITFDELIERAADTAKESGGLEVKLPMDDHTCRSLRNIINMLASKQNLLIQSLSLKEHLVEADFAEELSGANVDDMDAFKAAYLAAGPERCPGFRVDFEAKTFAFRIISDELDAPKVRAFTDLASLISTYAKALVRASAKPSEEDNPKFLLRVWLIRLGMSGEAYKESRKALIANLPGNSAFRRAAREGDADEA